MPIFTGTVGFVFRATVKDDTGAIVDLSAASELAFAFRQPNMVGAERRIATPTTDGTDGRMQYTTEAGDLDRDGRWKVQGFARIGGVVVPTSIHSFTVVEHLQDHD